MQEYSSPGNNTIQFFPLLEEKTLLEAKINEEKLFLSPSDFGIIPSIQSLQMLKTQITVVLPYRIPFLQSTSGTSMNDIIKKKTLIITFNFWNYSY